MNQYFKLQLLKHNQHHLVVPTHSEDRIVVKLYVNGTYGEI